MVSESHRLVMREKLDDESILEKSVILGNFLLKQQVFVINRLNIDQNFPTSQGPDSSFHFSLALV